MSAELSEDQIRRQLVPALHKLKGVGTLGDIVAAAGTPARATANVLNRTTAAWGGTLAVDERGEMLYRFPPSLSPPRDWSETWRQAAEVAYKAFKVFYKVLIGLVLVVYFVVFLVIMIALIVAAIAAATKDGDSDFDFNVGGNGFGNIWFWFIPDWRSEPPPRQYRRWERGRGLSAYEDKKRPEPVYNRVFNFVFGEEVPAVDPAAGDRVVLAFIRQHKGVITASDILALRGGTYEEAERAAVRLLADYAGEPDVSEDGTLLYRFPQVIRSAGTAEVRGEDAWHYWWEEPEEQAVLNRNGPGTNGVIIFFNLFNMAWSGWFVFSAEAAATVAELFGTAATPALTLFLGWIPFLFSLSLFAIPAIRWWVVGRENERRAHRNRQRSLLKGIAERARSGQAEVAQPGAAQDLLRDAVIVWQGDMQITEEGGTIYRFDRLRRELADAETARGQVRVADMRLGEIVYDSRKDLAEQ